ncbi:lambda-exonuclease family protein [Acinetobacter sp. ANC 7454]|uniref:YqaJ viral recombinase family nuclease n=1 Tax=Acinetobacter thermotolerans TaxID=3151487 RepID=UPI00325B25F9
MNTQVNTQEIENARQAWLEARRLGIGGSDVAAILGLSKYKSPYQLWLDKTGRTDVEDSQSEASYWGTTLEDIVAKEYAKRNGVKVQRVNATIVHPEHDWMRANIDRAIINPDISGNVRIKDGKLTTDRILECKTANQYLAKLWGDEQSEQVPDYYLTQVQWYMGITGASMCGLGVLIGGQKFRSYQVAFDPELFEMLTDECSKFWNEHVQADVPPAPTTFDDVTHRWERHVAGKDIDVDASLEQLLTEYKDLNGTIKEAEEELKALKLQIVSRFEDAEAIISGSKKLATYKYQERKTLDSTALKAAHPDIAEQFTKVSGTRVLRIN